MSDEVDRGDAATREAEEGLEALDSEPREGGDAPERAVPDEAPEVAQEEPAEEPLEEPAKEPAEGVSVDAAREQIAGAKRRRRWPWIVAGVLVLLVLLVVVGAFWARSWARDHAAEILERQAARYGWTLEVGAVELTWGGDLTMTEITARDEHGGALRIARMETGITPSEAWEGKRMPDAVALIGLEVELNPASLRSIAEHRAERDEEESGGGGAFPVVSLSEGSVRFESGEPSLGVVSLTGLAAELARAEEGWRSAGAGALSLAGSGAVGVTYELEAVLRRSWAHLEVGFDSPLEVRDAGLGRMGIEGFEVAGGPEALSGHLAGLSWTPAKPERGLESMAVSRVDFSLTEQGERGLWPESLRVVEPSARVAAEPLIYGPLGRRDPRIIDAYEEAQQRLDPEGWEARAETYAELRAELDEAPEASGAGVGASPGAALPGLSGLRSIDSLEALQAQMETLPGVVLERATLELVLWGDRRVRVSGFDFDTATLFAPRDEQVYEFNFAIRGAKGRIAVSPPEEAGAWPTVHFEASGVALTDAFALADQPPPEALAGTIDVDVTVARSAAGLLEVDGILRGEGVGFKVPRISSETVRGARGELELHVRYDREADTLTVSESAVRVGDFEVNIDVSAERVRRENTRVEFRVWAEELPCRSIGEAIPEGMLPDIERLEIVGTTMTAELKGRVSLDDWLSFRMRAEGFPGDCRVGVIEPFDVEALNSETYTKTYMGEPYTTLPEGITVGPGTDNWVSLERLPGYVPAVMYMTEDARFFDHGGIRIGLVNRAIRLNMEAGKYVYGGSSLTQQLVKNLFLYRRKHLARKLEELLLVWRVEEVVSKERILELYLNCIEFGPDVYGLEKAADFYFMQRPQYLSPLQVSYIASLKIKPSRGGKYYVRGFPKEGRWWNKRLKKIMVQLSEHGYISPVDVMAAAPWLAEFKYPDPGDADDWRNQWKEHYFAVQREKQRQESLRKKREEQEEREEREREEREERERAAGDDEDDG